MDGSREINGLWLNNTQEISVLKSESIRWMIAFFLFFILSLAIIGGILMVKQNDVPAGNGNVNSPQEGGNNGSPGKIGRIL
jgi:hypothetical protein